MTPESVTPHPAPPACPLCGGAWRIARLGCRGCGCALEADFAPAPLAALDPEAAAFALEFLRCGGNLRDLGVRLNLSYPTLRSRLDEVIARLGGPPPGMGKADRPVAARPSAPVAPAATRSILARKEQIVARIDAGELTPAKGKAMLKNLKKN